MPMLLVMILVGISHFNLTSKDSIHIKVLPDITLLICINEVCISILHVLAT